VTVRRSTIPPTGWRGLRSHRDWLGDETSRLLEFARGARVERGFGWLDADGTPERNRPLQLWITARMTHVFALGDLLGHPGCGPLADHGLVAIRDSFEDRERGGWFPEVSDDGPVRTDKEAYSHAFVLLAAASAAIAGREPATALLGEAVSVMEQRFWSEEESACLEGWDRGWEHLEGYRGANANMHMVEAFLAAGDATGDTRWYERARSIADRLVNTVARAHEWRILEHFDPQWRPLPDYNADQPRHPFRPFGVTPGHGLEWSRLLLQIHASIDQPPDWLVEAAKGLFARAVADGWGDPGGFAYTTDLAGRAVVADRLHWVVTEAIGAAAALHATTGAEEYERWYRTCWDFAVTYLLDRERGSWHAELDDDLRPSDRTWSGKPDVYHALQATLIPRLPVSPGLAGALRDGSLA
jgi:mannose/cellobiose epimerase-like protein (N-acyl-D-glucosamine 2-epimerase family)